MEKRPKLFLLVLSLVTIAGIASYVMFNSSSSGKPPSLENASTTFQGNISVDSNFSWNEEQIASFKGKGNENELTKGLNWRYFDKKVSTSELFLERIEPIEGGWAKAYVYNPIQDECIEGGAGFIELNKADDRKINDFCPIVIKVSNDTLFHGGLTLEDDANFDRVAGNILKLKDKLTEDSWILLALPKKYDELPSTSEYYFLSDANTDDFSATSKVDGVNLAWAKIVATVFDDEIIGLLNQEMDETHYVIDDTALTGSNELTIVVKGKIDTEWSKDNASGIIVQTDAGHKIYWAGPSKRVRASFKFADGKNFVVDASSLNQYTTNEEQVIVAVYDGQTMYLYRDGELLDSRTVGRELKTANGPTSIGASPEGENFFKGYLKEVSVYNRAYSPEEIKFIRY
jgi:Concanavalin A-like lectin/glucanases superfamily